MDSGRQISSLAQPMSEAQLNAAWSGYAESLQHLTIEQLQAQLTQINATMQTQMTDALSQVASRSLLQEQLAAQALPIQGSDPMVNPQVDRGSAHFQVPSPQPSLAERFGAARGMGPRLAGEITANVIRAEARRNRR